MRKLLVILFLLFPMLLKAEINNDFLITDLKISKTDKDATTARQKAITQGQREGFNKIIKNLGIDETNSILISDDEISQMIRSMQIKNEKITNESYSASLTMEFSPEYVKYALNKYKINKLSPKLNSYLIVPILNENGQTYLWERGNRWITAFRKNLVTSKNILLVEGDYSTRNALEIDYFNKPTFSKFKNLSNIYNVNNIVVVIGNYNKGDDIITVKIYTMDADKTKNATMNYEIANLNNVNLDFNGAAVKIIDYLSELNEQQQTLETTAAKLEDGAIYIFIPISSIKDYDTTNNILNNNKNITEIQLKMLSKNMAVYSVKYLNDDIASLKQSLKNSGFSISEKQNALYLFYNGN